MSQETDTVFSHNDTEYHFDLRDAEDMVRFEKALEVLRDKEKEAPKTGKASEILKYNCNMFKEFFDNCLGTGAGNAICTEKSNFSICYTAYMALIDFANQQKDFIVAAGNTLSQYGADRAKRNKR